jgi:hypothetical protein
MQATTRRTQCCETFRRNSSYDCQTATFSLHWCTEPVSQHTAELIFFGHGDADTRVSCRCRSVFSAYDLHANQIVAVKRASAAPHNDHDDHGIPVTLIRETGILRALRHPNIVQLRDKVIRSSRVFLVFELCHCNLGYVVLQCMCVICFYVACLCVCV